MRGSSSTRSIRIRNYCVPRVGKNQPCAQEQSSVVYSHFGRSSHAPHLSSASDSYVWFEVTMRSPTLLLSTLILILLLSLSFTPPSTSQSKNEVEDESREILERIKWFKERHPDVRSELRLK